MFYRLSSLNAFTPFQSNDDNGISRGRNTNHCRRTPVSGFTLLELLIVIGILAVLATIAVLVVNPLEYLRQSRDVKRIADIAALHRAVSLANGEGVALGASSSTVYVSLVDSTSTCANLGLPQLPAGWSYQCVTNAANLQKTDGTGWLPVNLSAISAGSPIGILPLDPLNNGGSGMYYEYMISGNGWELGSLFESSRYLKQTAATDGGIDPGRYEVGTDLSIMPKAEGLGLYWNFDEGNGTAVSDRSGNGVSGTLNGAPAWIPGKAGNALDFNGGVNYVTANVGNAPSIAISGPITLEAWVYPKGFAIVNEIIQKGVVDWPGYQLRTDGAAGYIDFYVGNSTNVSGLNAGGLSPNRWYHVVGTYDGTTLKVYVNGLLRSSTVATYGLVNSPSSIFQVGRRNDGYYYNGTIDEVKVYSRALSAPEVAAIYTATN